MRESAETLEMPGIDDAGVVRALVRIVTVEGADPVRKRVQKDRFDGAVHEGVIRRHAGLPGIEEFETAKDLVSTFDKRC